MPLEEYREKRRFGETPEPAGAAGGADQKWRRFVVQRHRARRLHYDLRLEHGGVLKSWAVPKGPSLNPTDKRLAVMTEDHPVEYLDFDGVIPEGNYGAGTMEIWDAGTYEFEGDPEPEAQFAKGDVKIRLEGRKLRGSFALVRLKPDPKTSRSGNDWLLIKHRDQFADPDWKIEEHDEPIPASGSGAESLAPTAGSLEGAVAAPMPREVEPMMATLVREPFSDEDWLFELKWDGMRLLCFVKDGACALRSRNGNDATGAFPELGRLPLRVRAREAILDGEAVVLDEEGRACFARMQRRMHVERPAPALVAAEPVDLYLFDILYCDGYDLRRVPLIERKRFLEQILKAEPPFRFSSHVEGQGVALYEAAKAKSAEGIVGKRKYSLYSGGRSTDWVKVKASRTVDAVIGGFTAPRGGRQHFGALLLGLYDNGSLVYIGSVGTGFDERLLERLYGEVRALETDVCPFAVTPDTKEPARWTEPRLVARVSFAGWTPEDRLRQPVFIELRRDADPRQCQVSGEKPAEAAAVLRPAKVTESPVLRDPAEIEHELYFGGAEQTMLELDGVVLRLTNLNKVYFPERALTKRHLIAHYWRVAKAMLPMLEDRPLVLRRHPNGIHGEAFYQKDAGADTPDWMTTVPIHSEGREGMIRYYVANTTAALLYLANLGCIEQNPWSSRVGSLEYPDYVYFDLDPTEETPYTTVVEVARRILEILDPLGVRVFLKTSGASGLHIYLPLEPVYSYEQARTFAEIVARLILTRLPELVTLERHVAKRSQGKIYVDYSQNGFGRPLAAVYCVRPVRAASVSTPLVREELQPGLSPEQFTITDFGERLAAVGDLWGPIWESRQRIEEPLEKLLAAVRGGPAD